MTADPAAECVQALERARLLLESERIPPGDYALVSAIRTLAAPGRWRLTYKPRRLLPARPDDEIGAGGEVFVEVDVVTGAASVAGHGE